MSDLVPINLTERQKHALVQTLELTGNYELVAHALMYVVDPVGFMSSGASPKWKRLAEYLGRPILALGEQP
jgi:hypothetical protein